MNSISPNSSNISSNSNSNNNKSHHQRSSSSSTASTSGSSINNSNSNNSSSNNNNNNNKLNIIRNQNNSPPGGVSPPMNSTKSYNGGTPTLAQLQSLVKNQKQPLNTSFDDLRNQLSATNIDLSNLEDDQEVIINHDYHSTDDEDEEEYEEEYEEYEEDDDDNVNNNNSVEYSNNNKSISSTHSCESIPEEEELNASPIVSRQYSYTMGSKPDNIVGSFSSPRSNRSESTVYHDEQPESEKVSNAKDKISSEYKKMMEDLDGFRNEKLKQRKSKYFSKKELEEIPFNPSSGTKLRSTLYKQFMDEKFIAMADSDKYRIELIKSYKENLKPADVPSPPSSIKQSSPNALTSLQAGNGGIILQKDRLNKLNRTRSVSQPPVVTSNSKNAIGTLEQILEKEKKRDGIERALPLLFIKCIEFLSNPDHLKTEGIFRVAGNSSDIEDLMKSILSYGSDIPSNCCVHVVSNMLKKFLRQLTTPIFTFKHHSDFIQATKLNNDQERVESIKKTLKLLPINNQILIKELMGFLVKVTEYSNVNMMHSYNLGLMLGPNVLKPPNDGDMDAISNLDAANQVITLIIENYNQIYDIK